MAGAVAGKTPTAAITPLKRTGALALAAMIGISTFGAGVITAPAAEAATDVSYSTPQQNGADWGHKQGVLVSGSWSGGGASGFSGDHFLGSRYIGGQPVTKEGYCIRLGVPSTSQVLIASKLANANGAAANYILSLPATTNAEKASVQVAMSTLLDPAFNMPLTSLSPEELAIVGLVKYGDDAAPYRARAEALIAEAKAAVASPASVQPLLTIAPDGRTGTVTSTGNRVDGLTATYTLTGPAVFSNGSNTITAPAAGANLSFTATGNGNVHVNEVVSGAVGDDPLQYSAPLSQTLAAVGPKITVSGASADVRVKTSVQPVATSSAPKVVAKGETLTDVIHPATADGSPWPVDGDGKKIPAKFKVVWYPDQSFDATTAPTNKTPYAWGEGTTTGEDITVTATNGQPLATGPGKYFSVVEFRVNDQDAQWRSYFTGDWTETDMTNQVSTRKAKPNLITTLIDNGDGTVSDKLTMTCDSTDTVNTPMTVTPVLNSSASAPVASMGTGTAPADNKVQATLPAITVHCGETVTTDPVAIPWESILNDYWNASPSVMNPTLYFTESAPAKDNTDELKPVYLHRDESIVLVKPTVSTQASENGTVPVTATDKATVIGTVPTGKNVSIGLDWKLYKFGDDTTKSVQAVCENAFWQSESTVSVTKAGEYLSAPVTLNDAGTYGFIEKLTMKYTDSNGQIKKAVLDEGKCGETSESVVVFPKNVTPNPEKPQLIAPVAYTGDVTPHQGMNDFLVYGGIGGVVLAAMALAMTLIIKRKADEKKKATAAFSTGEGNTSADELV